MFPRYSSDLEFEVHLTQKVCEIVDSPRSLCVFLLIENGEFAQLLDLQTDPAHYDSAGAFADSYLVTQMLRKSQNLPLGVDTEKQAFGTWQSCQVHNRLTNDRFAVTDYVELPYWWPRYVDYLRRVLGPLGPDQLQKIVEKSKHGPGAVAGVAGVTLVESHKYDMAVSVTTTLAPFAAAIMGPTWSNYHEHREAVMIDYEEFFTVRKDASTDRSCAKGPKENIFFQLGIGSHLRDRLKLFGVDLGRQDINQTLARLADRWHLATIDLSTASELMATAPTLRALPDRWEHLLNIARTTVTKVPGKFYEDGKARLVPQEKFCAMGNGFTFPLQTAIFLSVVRAIVPEKYHGLTCVYGDDIICPQSYATEVCAALTYLGLKVNNRKTCLAGRFFESCGTDWFDHQNVRPFFLRRDPESLVPYPLQAANMLRVWATRRAAHDGDVGSDARFRRLWESLLPLIPPPWRNPVPPELGDSGICMTLSEAQCLIDIKPLSECKALPGNFGRDAKPLRVDGWEGFAVRHVRLKAEKLDRRTYGVLLSGLGHMSDAPQREGYMHTVAKLGGSLPPDSTGREPLRGLYAIPKLGWTSVPSWSDGFGWTML